MFNVAPAVNVTDGGGGFITTGFSEIQYSFLRKGERFQFVDFNYRWYDDR